MSTTASFTSQAVAEWVKLFPRQATETYTSSVTFMKQLTVVAISTITYLKNVFPEESYKVESFGGIKLRVLKKKCRHELAQFVSTALTQAFEAFDKKYLHQLVLCFYDGECKAENLVEYHIFEYLYNSDGVTMNVHSKTRDSAKTSTRYSFDNVRERTVHLIRACVVIMQACQNEMPESYDVSLRLYYNEDAPEGYQAPGFLTTGEEQDHLEQTLPETVKLGYVETPFHRLTARTYIRENMGSSHDAIPSQNPPRMTQIDQDDFESSSAMRSVTDSSEVRVLCPCNKHDLDEANHAILTCQYCNTQQHAACFGLTRENASKVQRHCCTECSDMDPSRQPTDQRLATLSIKKRECLCIFRRTIEWCCHVATIGAQDLVDKFALSPVNASKLMKLLHSHGIINQGSESDLITSCEIILDQLKSVMSKFFQQEEPDLVDRLIAETLSQSSQPDPIGEVLSPMEKVNLQNATTLGKIIEPEQNIQMVEDETLKEYRNALMCDVDNEEGLPLSGSHNPVNVEDLGKRTGKRKSDTAKKTGVRTKRARASHD
ncbi:unnamed protein product [Spodoptera littoralis]|uniref:HORMA domain-containing protein n=1 Tax=Spodoptera littoralis TaxID=7109 RepID=A0A9P0HWQ8_SPOLI|nr:unnamed protein product [Spodoptera littoralis]CAH1635382.1 unnamed protein product [Spodoptera littoralis]